MKKVNLNEDLIQKINILSDECIECKKCMNGCPMLNEFCKSPKDLLKKISEDSSIDSIIPYSCTLCNYCTSVCPKDINLKKLFLDLRKDIIKNDKKSIKDLGYNVVKFHQMNSFSRIFTASFNPTGEKKIKTAFIPGCSLTAYSPELVMETYDYLKDNMKDIGIILKCCGNPTHSMGEDNKFNSYYSNLQNEIDKMGVEEIIVACPNCYKTIKNNSPDIKVTSLWEIITEFGVPERVKNIYEDVDDTFALHDPCPIRDEFIIHDCVRKIACELGIKIEEFKECREKTLCCGCGGMVGVTNNEIAIKQMQKRVTQVDSKYIMTYCQSCAESMTIGGKPGIHILDLIFNKEVYSRLKFQQISKSTLVKWKNRYKGKKLIKKQGDSSIL